MRLNRVTKSTARFAEEPVEGKPEALGSIYIKRWILGSALNGIPLGDVEGSELTISVTVE